MAKTKVVDGTVLYRQALTRITKLEQALQKAISAGEYVVRLVEDTGACGLSPNPNVKSDWLGTAMHCYAAMSFLQEARAALKTDGV